MKMPKIAHVAVLAATAAVAATLGVVLSGGSSTKTASALLAAAPGDCTNGATIDFQPGGVISVTCDTGTTTTTTVPATTTTVPASSTTQPSTTTTAAPTTSTTAQPTTTTTVPATTTTTVPTPGSAFTAVYKQWANGPDPSGANTYIPIAVWEQDENRTEGGQANALNYKAIGINADINGYDPVPADGLPDWSGGGSGQFGMDAPYSHDGAANILWDEADMTQVNYGVNNELTAPAFAKLGQAMQAADTSRPVFDGFGKCFSVPDWNGCQDGNPPNSPAISYDKDLTTYCSGVDIAAADYYGFTDPYQPANEHNAYTYGANVSNIVAHCPSTTPVFFDVETGHPFTNGGNSTDPSGTITPAQVEQATWDGIMHGAHGVIYFVHNFTTSNTVEDGLLQSSESATKAVVAADNAEMKALAPWLNAPSASRVAVTSTGGVPMVTMDKVVNGHEYLFAMSDGSASLPASGSTTATITVPSGISSSAAVYGESRNVQVTGGKLSDSFAPYQMHVYELS